MKVYFISGLAADSRVFTYIKLPDNCETVYLEWIKPLHNESLKSYAMRLAQQIDTSKPFSVIGLSMGGMIASEIAQLVKPSVTILISSVPVSSHLPFYFKVAGKLRLHKFVTARMVKSAAVIKRFFTAETNEDKVMIRQIIKESDAGFIHWAINAILKWRNDQFPASYIHIHGTRDEVLPIRCTKPTHIIFGAGHLMIMTHAGQLNKILSEVLANVKVN
ncbi:MAG TPA: alpha/beta hydrolase [Puia sp.]|nr:alpha/beta hydrolase [Puia sp.]